MDSSVGFERGSFRVGDCAFGVGLVCWAGVAKRATKLVAVCFVVKLSEKHY